MKGRFIVHVNRLIYIVYTDAPWVLEKQYKKYIFIICDSLCKNHLNPLGLHGNLKKKWIPLIYV